MACAATVVAYAAVAAGGADGKARATEGDDHAAVQAIVNAVAADTAHAAITGELLDRARRELERAAGLRATYDEKRARAADGAAREWAETARDVLRAVDAEGKAAEVRKNALDAQVQVDRTRALVDEDTARIGRLKAQLEGAEREAKAGTDPDRKAIEVHEGEPAPKKKGPRKTPDAKPAAPAPTPPDATGGKP